MAFHFYPSRIILLVAGVALFAGNASGLDLGGTLVADGFDLPVGRPNGVGYYRSRGFHTNGHLGEDWNGRGGGDSDLGDPVYSIGHGLVMLSKNCGHGWGNVVIIRHVYEEAGEHRVVDSFYAHLDKILVRYGQQLRRGHKIGTIGTAGGLYPAHLHFEIRKDTRVGMARHRFPHDERVYWSPTEFIGARRRLRPSVAVAAVRMNTFTDSAVDALAANQGPRGFRLPPIAAGMPLILGTGAVLKGSR